MLNYAVRMIKLVEALPRTVAGPWIADRLPRCEARADFGACLLLFVFCLFIPITQPLCAQPRPFRPQDMVRVVTFAEGSEPVISPAGDWVAYAAVDVDQESNILARHPTAFLYVVKSDGSGTRHLPNSQDHADTPVWSPDSRKLAFVSYLLVNP